MFCELQRPEPSVETRLTSNAGLYLTVRLPGDAAEFDGVFSRPTERLFIQDLSRTPLSGVS